MLSFSSLIFLNYSFLGGLFENDSFMSAVFTLDPNLFLSYGTFFVSGLEEVNLLDKSFELDTDDKFNLTLSILYSRI
jgi:hypothetical protein